MYVKTSDQFAYFSATFGERLIMTLKFSAALDTRKRGQQSNFFAAIEVLFPCRFWREVIYITAIGQDTFHYDFQLLNWSTESE